MKQLSGCFFIYSVLAILLAQVVPEKIGLYPMTTKVEKNSYRYGGRQKGTPNKDKQELLELIQATGCKHPLQGLAEIAKQSHESGELELATTCYKELAQYVAAKRKAVEHSGEIEQKGPLVVVLDGESV